MDAQSPLPPAHLSSGNPHPRILIADDETETRIAIRMLLEDEGYEVLEAEDGLAAIEILRRSLSPLVVLLDLVMPRLSGYEVLRSVTADPQLITRHAYLVLSAASLTPSRMDGWFAALLTTHDIPMLAKPFDLDDLLAAVVCLWNRLAPDQLGQQREGGAL